MQNIVYDGKNYECHSDAHIYRIEGEKKARIKKAEWLAIKAQHEAEECVSALEGEMVEANPETPPKGENAPTLGVDGLVIEIPLDGFTDIALDNLERLVAAKATLIKRAIGAEALPIKRKTDTLAFPWFSAEATPEEVQAYAVFVERICTAAKAQKRVTAVAREVENEKYAFRCFLLKLGFIGEEYKSARKILLARLEGNGTFRTPKQSN